MFKRSREKFASQKALSTWACEEIMRLHRDVVDADADLRETGEVQSARRICSIFGEMTGLLQAACLPSDQKLANTASVEPTMRRMIAFVDQVPGAEAGALAAQGIATGVERAQVKANELGASLNPESRTIRH